MRIFVVLALLLSILAMGCGGEEMTSGTPDASNTGQPDGDKPKEPEKKKIKLSPEAVLVAGEYKMVKNVRDYETKKRNALEKAKQHAFTPPDAQLYVGELYRLGEDNESAAMAYEKFVMGCPESKNLSTGRYYAGLCYAKAGKLEKAEQFLGELTTHNSDEVKSIRSLGMEIGMAYLKLGQPEKALPHLQAAADTGNSYAAEELMGAQWLAGEFDAARATGDKLLVMAEGKPKATERAQTFKKRAGLMGKPAKPIEAEGFTMETFGINDLAGKVYLVYFWKMPQRGNALKTTRMMSKLFDEYGEKGLMIVGLSKHYGYDPRDHNAGTGRDLTAAEEVDALGVWAQQTDLGYNVRWPLGVTKDEGMQAPYGFYPAQAIPAFALVGKKGKLRYFRQGFDETGFAMMKIAIEKCLAE